MSEKVFIFMGQICIYAGRGGKIFFFKQSGIEKKRILHPNEDNLMKELQNQQRKGYM